MADPDIHDLLHIGRDPRSAPVSNMPVGQRPLAASHADS